jgi:transketolase
VFTLGKAVTLREGSDVAFVATGEAVPRAVAAADDLAREGLACRVLSMHTVKPLDGEAVAAAARECRAIVTAEEHHVHGGLGEACAAFILESGLSVPFRIVGIPDEYTVTGSQVDIFRHYGISREGLADAARRLLKP